MKKPIFRWTIGPANPAGWDCLLMSIKSFMKFYDADAIVCFNCEREKTQVIPSFVDLYDQRSHMNDSVTPMGVAWKLYPTRLFLDRHEISIDNDIVIEKNIPEIDKFLKSDCTLLLQTNARNYGRFENHVPPKFCINSGIYGMPPDFNLNKYFQFYVGKAWEENAIGNNKESKTFDEQGLVATALLDYQKFVIIPDSSVTNCENQLVKSNGMHFIGVNRRKHHKPFQIYRSLQCKTFM